MDQNRIHDLLSQIDRILDERQNVRRIERGVKREKEFARIEIFSIDSSPPANIDLVAEIEKTATMARKAAVDLGFRASSVQKAIDRPSCRYFTVS